MMSPWKLYGIMAAACLLIVLPTHASPRRPLKFRGEREVNGGVSCATCTVVVALLEQTSEFHNETLTKSMERICSYLPPDPDRWQRFCKAFVDTAGPLLIKLIVDDADPDRVCSSLGLCRTDPGRQTCHALGPPPADFEKSVHRGRQLAAQYGGLFRVGIHICDLPGIKEICQIITQFSDHFPLVDADFDGFSEFSTFRGSSWRGKDCNDKDGNMHPGAIPVDGDKIHDSNCNGIYGTNPDSLLTWESELCADSDPRGIAVLGDSISAHFHLPEEWFDATKLSAAVFKHLDFIVENEIDWPELSTVTGLGFNDWQEVIDGPMDSIYMRMRERNRCNHKDYQNIAVNGADSGSMDKPIMESLSRKQEKDRPLVVIYALVGNDVCNGHIDDTFAHMTTPQQMRINVLKTLDYLDTQLPLNSSVFLIGLADGRVLYDSLKDRIHPLGRYWNRFTYPEFYDYFNCLQVSPCAGWLNTNETVRNMTTVRANQLSAVLEDVAAKNKTYYKHYTLYYSENPINKAIAAWKLQGGEAWQLLEPVDGFHSNQYGQSLTAQVVWDDMYKMAPGVFGPLNPNNDKITQMFGDQGPYF